jgi:hypothetical protein
MLTQILIQIIVSFMVVFLLHYLYQSISTHFSTKRPKDTTNDQIRKYKEIVDEMSQKRGRSTEATFTADERRDLYNELSSMVAQFE